MTIIRIDNHNLIFDTKQEFKEYFDKAKKLYCCKEYHLILSQFCNEHFQQFIRSTIKEEELLKK